MTELLHETTSAAKGARDYVAKARALLDLAEKATTQEERDLATSRAMTIMTRHSITDSMVGSTREVPDEIGQIELDFTGVLAEAQRELAVAISYALGCDKLVVSNLEYRKPKVWRLTVTGWKTDLERLQVLVASIQLQATNARKQWEREQKRTGWNDLPRYEKLKDQRTFVLGYRNGVRGRLQTAYSQAVKDAAKERAEESHGTETEQEAMTGVALALRSRKESVADWYDAKYGKSLRSSRAHQARGSYGAMNAGHAAGTKADVGQTRVGGGYRAIGR
jgi:hypothetical protein